MSASEPVLFLVSCGISWMDDPEKDNPKLQKMKEEAHAHKERFIVSPTLSTRAFIELVVERFTKRLKKLTTWDDDSAHPSNWRVALVGKSSLVMTLSTATPPDITPHSEARRLHKEGIGYECQLQPVFALPPPKIKSKPKSSGSGHRHGDKGKSRKHGADDDSSRLSAAGSEDLSGSDLSTPKGTDSFRKKKGNELERKHSSSGGVAGTALAKGQLDGSSSSDDSDDGDSTIRFTKADYFRVRALCDHDTKVPGELSFMRGESFAIVGKVSATVFKASHKGRMGKVPGYKLARIDDLAGTGKDVPLCDPPPGFELLSASSSTTSKAERKGGRRHGHSRGSAESESVDKRSKGRSRHTATTSTADDESSLGTSESRSRKHRHKRRSGASQLDVPSPRHSAGPSPLNSHRGDREASPRNHRHGRSSADLSHDTSSPRRAVVERRHGGKGQATASETETETEGSRVNSSSGMHNSTSSRLRSQKLYRTESSENVDELEMAASSSHVAAAIGSADPDALLRVGSRNRRGSASSSPVPAGEAFPRSASRSRASSSSAGVGMLHSFSRSRGNSKSAADDDGTGDQDAEDADFVSRAAQRNGGQKFGFFIELRDPTLEGTPCSGLDESQAYAVSVAAEAQRGVGLHSRAGRRARWTAIATGTSPPHPPLDGGRCLRFGGGAITLTAVVPASKQQKEQGERDAASGSSKPGALVHHVSSRLAVSQKRSDTSSSAGLGSALEITPEDTMGLVPLRLAFKVVPAHGDESAQIGETVEVPFDFSGLTLLNPRKTVSHRVDFSSKGSSPSVSAVNVAITVTALGTVLPLAERMQQRAQFKELMSLISGIGGAGRVHDDDDDDESDDEDEDEDDSRPRSHRQKHRSRSGSRGGSESPAPGGSSAGPLMDGSERRAALSKFQSMATLPSTGGQRATGSGAPLRNTGDFLAPSPSASRGGAAADDKSSVDAHKRLASLNLAGTEMSGKLMRPEPSRRVTEDPSGAEVGAGGGGRPRSGSTTVVWRNSWDFSGWDGVVSERLSGLELSAFSPRPSAAELSGGSSQTGDQSAPSAFVSADAGQPKSLATRRARRLSIVVRGGGVPPEAEAAVAAVNSQLSSPTKSVIGLAPLSESVDGGGASQHRTPRGRRGNQTSATSSPATARRRSRAGSINSGLAPVPEPSPLATTPSDGRRGSEDNGSQTLVYRDSENALSERRRVLSAGTLDALIGRLAGTHVPDRLFIEQLLLVHPRLIHSRDLLSRLTDVYRSGAGTSTPSVAELVRLRVINVLKVWVETDARRFQEDAELLNGLRSFLDYVRMERKARLGTSMTRSDTVLESEYAEGAATGGAIDDEDDWASMIEAVLQEHMDGLEKSLTLYFDPNFDYPRPLLPFNLTSTSITILEFAALEVARQLTVVDHSTFQTVRVSDCFPAKRLVAPSDGMPDANAMGDAGTSEPDGLAKLIDRFNRVSFWVATEVVTTANFKRRVAIVERFIEIARHCLELQNFQSLMAIFSALNLACIQRLKQTWRHVRPELMETLKDVEKLMTGLKNFKVYREHLAGLSPPACPFPGVLMQDITFLEENPEHVAGGLLNWDKMRLFHKVLSDMVRWQAVPYRIQQVPVVLEFIDDISSLSEAELFRQSKLVEPKGADYGPPSHDKKWFDRTKKKFKSVVR